MTGSEDDDINPYVQRLGGGKLRVRVTVTDDEGTMGDGTAVIGPGDDHYADHLAYLEQWEAEWRDTEDREALWDDLGPKPED